MNFSQNMNPEMIRMAQNMMSKMPPEQIKQMQELSHKLMTKMNHSNTTNLPKTNNLQKTDNLFKTDNLPEIDNLLKTDNLPDTDNLQKTNNLHETDNLQNSSEFNNDDISDKINSPIIPEKYLSNTVIDNNLIYDEQIMNDFSLFIKNMSNDDLGKMGIPDNSIHIIHNMNTKNIIRAFKLYYKFNKFINIINWSLIKYFLSFMILSLITILSHN